VGAAEGARRRAGQAGRPTLGPASRPPLCLAPLRAPPHHPRPASPLKPRTLSPLPPAGRALEYCAIRSAPQEEGEERDHDADIVLALIQLLSLGPAAIPVAGAATGAAALLRAVSLGGGDPGDASGPSVAMVRDASVALAAIIEASSPEALAAAAAGAAPGRRATDHSQSAGGAPPGPLSPPANGRAGTASAGGAPPAPSSPYGEQQHHDAPRPPTPPRGGDAGGTPDPHAPAAMLPSVVTDHSTGLAVLRTWSGERGGAGRGHRRSLH
jgi:hypothetical protein